MYKGLCIIGEYYYIPFVFNYNIHTFFHPKAHIAYTYEHR
jgi:hypothetical protein